MDLTNKLLLAPMAGVTDHPFRRLCRAFGADYAYTEMISAKALCYHDKKTAVLAKIYRDDLPISVQIFGSDPEIMGKAAYMLSRGEYAYCESEALPAAIDVNMGCPVRKVVSNREGSALMLDESLAQEIVCAVRENSTIPVTVKMRAGFDDAHKNAVSLAEKCEKAGAAAICVHGRTREQMYRPPADLTIIREVKEAVSIPVIGNGDLFTPEDVVRMQRETGCDALMIARGALGNPFLFDRARKALASEKTAPPHARERILCAMRHLDLLIEDRKEASIPDARKHVAWYIKGIPGAAEMRDEINRAKSPEDFRRILRAALERAGADPVQSENAIDIF